MIITLGPIVESDMVRTDLFGLAPVIWKYLVIHDQSLLSSSLDRSTVDIAEQYIECRCLDQITQVCSLLLVRSAVIPSM